MAGDWECFCGCDGQERPSGTVRGEGWPAQGDRDAWDAVPARRAVAKAGEQDEGPSLWGDHCGRMCKGKF